MAQTKPRVFLSSTILDFSDLRSAIKYWLEESGYEVNASEYNDFQKPLEKNSYDACLAAIESCQYFILLIGARAGGQLSSPSNTTITMAEYRRAYELALAGKMKILSLVRGEVWTVREDRKALAEVIRTHYQREHSLSDDEVKSIKHHKSRVIADADIVFSFINEVARLSEMKAATKDAAAPLPLNNWIHVFSNFREVVDALRTTFVRSTSLRQAALLASLRQELISNLSRLHTRTEDGSLRAEHVWGSAARRQFSGGPDDASRFVEINLKMLAMFGYTAISRLLSHALEEAISSGEFLDFRLDADSFFVGPVQQALLDLKKYHESIESLCSSFLTVEKRAELLDWKDYKSKTKTVTISNVKTGGLMVLHDQYANTIAISLALLRFIETGTYVPPKMTASTPFAGQEEKIRAERPTTEDILKLASTDR